MNRLFTRAATAGAVVALLATPAFAHITLEVGEAPVGSTYKAIFRLPHGCSGTATTAVRLRLPDGFIGAKPMPKAGWTLDITTGDYATPHKSGSSEVTSGALEISWSGGNLPDNQYDEFVVRGTIASDLKVGHQLNFPLIQSCGTAEEAWIEIQQEGQPEPDYPAPSLKLTEAAGEDH